MSLLLTLNAGSSSIKFALFEQRPHGLERLAVGQVEGLGERAHFCAVTTAGERHEQWLDGSVADHGHALQGVLDWLRLSFPNREVAAVSHRVVHGGAEHVEPIVLDDQNRAQLETLVPLAPLHQPHNLAGIDAARAAFPQAQQVACFDTSFHRSHPFVADTFALPRQYYEQGFPACLTSSSRASSRAATRACWRAGSSWRTWAMARRCAPCAPAARSPRPWVSPRSTACRWARAAARSIRACCCIWSASAA